jgi:Ricin-type beta-trefoil lectin domain
LLPAQPAFFAPGKTVRNPAVPLHAFNLMTIQKASHSLLFAAITSTLLGCALSVPKVANAGPIISHGSEKCLDVANSSRRAGDPVIQFSCHYGANQEWQVRPYKGAYQLIASHSGQCLNVKGGSRSEGTPIIQWPCEGNDNELWDAIPARAGSQLRARNSGLCLNVEGGSTSDGARLIQWACEGTPNELWDF